tara:strand:- start:208 stop:909 length:702 start_codon:yes stop_codon:yes gene_type:complete
MQKEIDKTVRMIGLISSSASGNELCRRLATDGVFGEGSLGVQLFALTDTGTWKLLGSYGKNPFALENLTQLNENILTEAARTRQLAFGSAKFEDQEADVVACVSLRDGVPVGAVARSSTKGTAIFDPQLGTLKAIQDAGGLFLDAIGYKTVVKDQAAKQASPEDMTERQLEILMEMSHGKTNLVISGEMILSESTIKQESVKIFRALGVSNRQQAVLKSRTLGLLPPATEIVS